MRRVWRRLAGRGVSRKWPIRGGDGKADRGEVGGMAVVALWLRGVHETHRRDSGQRGTFPRHTKSGCPVNPACFWESSGQMTPNPPQLHLLTKTFW